MDWLTSIDHAVYRFLNGGFRNPALDWLMPVLSGNPLFIPAVMTLIFLLLWKGGRRGRLFVLLLIIVVAVGDGVICRTLKEVIGRARPFGHGLTRGSMESMPSAHAANMFGATMAAFLFYPRSWRFMLPLAVMVSLSRIYNGVHYPSDVMAGAILGAGYTIVFAIGLNFLWHRLGRAWFPIWWHRVPVLVGPITPARQDPALEVSPPAERIVQMQWLHLGYCWIAFLLLVRLFYIASDIIELSEDEAYQWLWSKHLALSYFSKPPLIAYAQWSSTALFGDTEFGVRFWSPVLAALLSFVLLRFFYRQVNGRVGFWLVFSLSLAPLLAVGSTLITIDPLLVFFWTLALVTGWRAVQPRGTLLDWALVGWWMGLAFLSKYTALFQWVSWAFVFWLIPFTRKHLRRPGPYLALAINLVMTLPVLIWNAQNGWVTLSHVATDAKLDEVWKPHFRYLGEFLGSTVFLLHPILFVAAAWAAIRFWKQPGATSLQRFLFCMGAPVYLFYLAYTIHSRVLPNWIAAAVVPLFALMVIYWEARWKSNARRLRPWLIVTVVLGVTVVVALHDTGLIRRAAGIRLPVSLDPSRRVRGWSNTAAIVENARLQLEQEGPPAFIIGNHYGITGQMAFYNPRARANPADLPLVYYRTTDRPRNQFYFWPGYQDQRQGQNAIFVREDWTAAPPPRSLVEEFESVTSLGLFDVKVRGQILRRVHLFACRGLKRP